MLGTMPFWRCAILRRNGPYQFTLGRTHSTASRSFTKTGAAELSAMIANEPAAPKSRAVETVEKRTACFSTVPPAPTTGKGPEENPDQNQTDHLHKTIDATGFEKHGNAKWPCLPVRPLAATESLAS